MKILFPIILFFAPSSFGAEFTAQARLFITNTTADIDQLNQEVTGEGIKEFGKLERYGVEITYPWKPFEIGLSYSRRGMVKDETTSNPATDYNVNFTSDVFLFVGRYPVVKSKFARFDIFAGVGGSNTNIKFETAGQNGELSNGKTATPFYTYGASAAFGTKGFYFYIEGGYEHNKIDTVTRTGTVSATVQELNLAGPYAAVGILFDGVKATK